MQITTQREKQWGHEQGLNKWDCAHPGLQVNPQEPMGAVPLDDQVALSQI